MVRGVEGRAIFRDDADRADFVRRLGWVVPESGAGCYAWALVGNHAHLLLQTGPQPLATVMARLGTGYVLRFNQKYARAGHLFQNRYKSLLVQDDPYFLVAVRYVHANPVRAGLVESVDALSAYPWTGHAALMGRRAAGFQDVDRVLSLFGPDRAQARCRLARWMAGDPGPGATGLEEPASHERSPAPHGQTAPTEAVAPRRRTLDHIVARVCRELGVDGVELASRSKRKGVSNARAAICYLAAREPGIRGIEVARALRISEPAVSRARQRGRRVVERSPVLSGLADSQGAQK